MIQIDTPSSPESPWVCAEVETAVGKRIPILPVVFHDDSVKTHPSRFRDLSYLHRRVCIQSQSLDGQFQILDDQLPILANELTDYLLKVYERRVIQPRLLENAFRSQNWNFSIFPTRRHLHKASRNVPANTPLNLLGCCSFEDFFFAPSCDAFLNDILDLSKEEGMAFSRSLYFYDGNVLYPQDLRSIMHREVTGLADANAELVHYVPPSEPLTPSQLQGIRDYANRNVGRRYGLRQFFNPNAHPDGRIYCSQFVHGALTSAGIPLPARSWHTPDRLLHGSPIHR